MAERLRADPDGVRAKGRANVQRMRRVHGASVEAYARAWEALLDGPLDELVSAMLAQTQEATDLRHATPFAGVLSPRARWEAYRTFGRWWSEGVGRQ